MTLALLITGSPGAGKSTVLDRLSTRLELAEVPYGAIEADELGRGWPFTEFAEWCARLELVCGHLRACGRDRILVVATVETDEQLADTVAAIGADRTRVVCLAAPPAVAAARVEAREPDDWPGKPWLVAHAAEVAEEIPQLAGIERVISSHQRSAQAIAAELAGWAGLIRGA